MLSGHKFLLPHPPFVAVQPVVVLASGGGGEEGKLMSQLLKTVVM